MKFIVVTETYDYGQSLRKILIPIDMIKFVQDCVPEKDKNTFLAIRDYNEDGKMKFFWITESLDDVIKLMRQAQ